MNILVAAVGKIGRGPESELAASYLQKTRWNVTLKELADAPSSLPAAQRKIKEAAAILDVTRKSTRLIALDSSGEAISSNSFCTLLTKAQRDGVKELAFTIGGQDGLDETVLKSAHKVIAFGAATWPHKLVRVLLVEQLYRAYTITIGHPYHQGH